MATVLHSQSRCSTRKTWFVAVACVSVGVVAIGYWICRCMPYGRERVAYNLLVVDAESERPVAKAKVGYLNCRSFKALPNRVEEGTASTDSEGKCILRLKDSRLVFVRVKCPGYEEGFVVLPLDRALLGRTRILLHRVR